MSEAGTAPSASEATKQAVLGAVTEMLTEVIGEDELLMVDEVTMDTSFNDDLELESIEFVALAEELTERYGEQVDFVGWLADLELDALVTMTVGQLVEFVAGCLDGSAEA
ncbi:MAG TPA: acyl carrier protein [Acidimicrobiales bacterium]|nr:acyl carrier protein [Acidimicrobiales bacterium]